MAKHGIILLLFLSLYLSSFGQNSMLKNDSAYFHNRKKAAILSAIIPGSGQIYNEIGYRKVQNKKHRAWWKAPLIYGGLGTCAYYFYTNNQNANLLKQEYQFREANDGQVLDQRLINYSSQSELISGYSSGDITVPGFDLYAKRRDLFVLAFVGVWGINVVESFVDAHFVTFDVSEDLSLSWHPRFYDYKTPGLSLTLNFQ